MYKYISINEYFYTISPNVVCGNRTIDANVNLKIHDVVIERVYENKFLGVTLDDKLCWKPHINYLCTKMSKSIGILAKTKYILNLKALHTLYCTLILPYLSYCVEVWGNTYKSSLKKLCTLQKRSIRIIHNVGYLDHTNSLFLQSHILKFTDLVNFRSMQMVFKARNYLLPRNLQKMFKDKEVGRYNLRTKEDLEQPFVRTNQKHMCISVSGVHLWNELQEEIRKSSSLTQFKNKYKFFIFNKYRNEGVNWILLVIIGTELRRWMMDTSVNLDNLFSLIYLFFLNILNKTVSNCSKRG